MYAYILIVIILLSYITLVPHGCTYLTCSFALLPLLIIYFASLAFYLDFVRSIYKIFFIFHMGFVSVFAV